MDKTRTELCARSGYAIGGGIGTIEELVKVAKASGINALALCDDYSTNGFDELSRLSKKAGIRALYGCTINVEGQRVALIAKTRKGIYALNELISEASADSSKKLAPTALATPSFNKKEDLKKHPEDILSIALLEDYSKLDELLANYDYVGVKDLGVNFPQECCSRREKRILALSDSYYSTSPDRLLFDALRGRRSSYSRKLRSKEELLNLFPKEWVIDNPNELLSHIEEDCYLAPTAPNVPELIDRKTFIETVETNLKDKFPKLDIPTSDRLEAELSEILNGKYETLYFLAQIITSLITSNEGEYLMTGPACCSLVSYILGISKINPLEWDLPYQVYLGGTPSISMRIPADFLPMVEGILNTLCRNGAFVKEGFLSTYQDYEALEKVANYLKASKANYEDAKEAKVLKLCSSVKSNNVRPYTYYLRGHQGSYLDYSPLRKAKEGEEEIPILLGDSRKHSSFYQEVNYRPSSALSVLDELKKRLNSDLSEVVYNEEFIALLKGDSPLKKSKTILKNTSPLLGVMLLEDASKEEISFLSKAKDLKGFCKSLSLLRGGGTYKGNAEILLKEGHTLDELATDRESLFNLLTKTYKASPSLAKKVTDDLRRGRGLKPSNEEALVALGIPSYLLDSLKKIDYLTDLSYVIQLSLLSLKEAYCKIHHPIEFYESTLNVAYPFETSRLEAYTKEQLLKGYQEKTIPDPYQKQTTLILEALERGLEYEIKDGKIKFHK